MPHESRPPDRALSAALRLAARGVPVFPCHASKAPACPHGFHDATNDAASLTAIWRQYPGSLVGVPTGPASGGDVLDLDLPRHREAREWWEMHRADIPATWTHRSRSGGLHVWFRQVPEVRNSAGRIAPGVDVRGTGGCAIWWPAAGCAVLDRSPLAPWPDWLLPMVLPPVQNRAIAMPPLPVMQGDGARRYALAALRNAIQRVAAAPQGSRNHALNCAAYALCRLAPAALDHAEIADALAVAARHAGLPAREVAATLASALHAGSRA